MRRLLLRFTRMVISAVTSRSERPTKRIKLEDLSQRFRDGVMLAPMVRSGSLPTRLVALKYGASLVWGPEVIDKAILHATRNVDPVTGVVSYDGNTKAIFTTHPIEKPYLVYQMGSADPDLAVQAARAVLQDVGAIDLNCGCPKPFSTHAGMGAALLTDPDNLCAILTALRDFLPPDIPLSVKIRLLPSQDDTLRLVSRILETGISALTVHCRTRAMRREPALLGRLQEIVKLVEDSERNVAVLANGDCLGYSDAQRVRELTTAHSVMIATAAESNPSCFSLTPLVDLEETLVPVYLRLARYLGNNWGNTKFCVSQFQGRNPKLGKIGRKAMKEKIAQARDYDGMKSVVQDWALGSLDFADVKRTVGQRGTMLEAKNGHEITDRTESDVEMLTEPEERLRDTEPSGDLLKVNGLPTLPKTMHGKRKLERLS